MTISRILPSRRFVLVGAVCLVAVMIVVLYCDQRVVHTAAPYVFDGMEGMPHNEVALVLGTSERGRGGGANPYFQYRMEAAAALYHEGKVHHLLVSGDNRRVGYNEPLAMRTALIAAGVDSTDITLDFAGFRTLDSVVRARRIFGQQQFTIVSQRFHNERAIYIARQHGLDAVGYNAQDVGAAYGMKTRLREKLARVKVFVDDLFGVEPHFLGDPVQLGQQVLP